MDRIATVFADRFLGGVEALIEGTTLDVVLAELGLILALWFARPAAGGDAWPPSCPGLTMFRSDDVQNGVRARIAAASVPSSR